MKRASVKMCVECRKHRLRVPAGYYVPRDLCVVHWAWWFNSGSTTSERLAWVARTVMMDKKYGELRAVWGGNGKVQ